MQSPELGYYLGGHAWAAKEWVGSFLPANTPSSNLLSAYSQQVNCVEGNSTFYGMPDMSLVDRWMEQSADGFQFCFKFPRSISHDHQLQSCQRESHQFLKILAAAQHANRLGPALLQLGPRFDGGCFHLLEKFLIQLPKDFSYAVEMRHLDYFEGGSHEVRLNELLSQHEMNRAIFDTRALYAKPHADASEQRAQSKKPKMPLCQVSTGKHPMVRLVGKNNMQDNGIWAKEWAPKVAAWIQEGKTPYIFVHTPDDVFFPEQSHAWHEALRDRCPAIPELPFEPVPAAPQLDLF